MALFPFSETAGRCVTRRLSRALGMVLLSFWFAMAEDCTRLSNCEFTCSGDTFDLSSLGNPSGVPKYKDVAAVVGDFLYSYNPCYPFTETDPAAFPNGCENVASCQVVRGSAGSASQFYGCGTQPSVTFQKLPGSEISALIESDDLFLVATYSGGDGGRKTKVLFTCADSEKFSVIGEDPNNILTYVYMLAAPNVCVESEPSGLSVGTILLIIFFALLFVYLVAGMALMRVQKGARGAEVIPNRDLWVMLPGLIKDGVLFLTGGCKPLDGYQKL